MNLDVQFKIKSNPLYQKYLRENSTWYKLLNRNPMAFNDFVLEMKNNYCLRPSDRLNKMLNNINLIQNFLNILK